MRQSPVPTDTNITGVMFFLKHSPNVSVLPQVALVRYTIIEIRKVIDVEHVIVSGDANWYRHSRK